MRHVKILGTGCRKCRQLTDNVTAAVDQLGAECEVLEVTELTEIMQHGVMLTPGLVVDDQVTVTGRVPTVDEIKAMLRGQGGEP